jgi:hypothetical protein
LTRPWRIDAVYLFDAAELLAQRRAHNVNVGVATSVRQNQWEAAEIFPEARNPRLPLTPTQKSLLRLLAGPGGTGASAKAPSQ